MRDIEEIIQELKNHPDYMVSEIYTWGEYLDEVNDDIYGFLDEIEADNFEPIQKSELTPKHIQEIMAVVSGLPTKKITQSRLYII